MDRLIDTLDGREKLNQSAKARCLRESMVIPQKRVSETKSSSSIEVQRSTCDEHTATCRSSETQVQSTTTQQNGKSDEALTHARLVSLKSIAGQRTPMQDWLANTEDKPIGHRVGGHPDVHKKSTIGDPSAAKNSNLTIAKRDN